MPIMRHTIENVRDAERGSERRGSDLFNVVPAGTINGANTSFTVPGRVRAGSMRLYLSGLRLVEGTHYTLTVGLSTTAIAYTAPPAEASYHVADYQV